MSKPEVSEEKAVPLVSIVVPVYRKDDSELFIGAVNSLLRQTYENVEVVIVVDGPLSAALDLGLESFLDQARVRVIRQPSNQGVSVARNLGVQACRGKYIGFLDADDFSVPERIDIQLRYLRENDLDLVSSYLSLRDDKGDMVGIRKIPVHYAQVRRLVLLSCPIHNTAVLARASVLKDHQFAESMSVAEDYDLWVRLLILGYRLGNVPEPLVIYTQPDASISKRRGIEYAKADFRVKWNCRRLVNVSLTPVVFLVAGATFFARLLPRALFNPLYSLRKRM